jgi:CubicO group peptidase (beta-lactamase class C family)
VTCKLLLLPLILLAASGSSIAQVPDQTVGAVRARAEAANFDGAILIGEPDGQSKVITIGTRPVSPDAVWRWASITKQIAAVVAMQEVARGTLDLDAPIARYWPAWKGPNAARIRVRDLLLHNSGLPQPDESAADKDGVPAFYRSAAAAPSVSADGFCAGPPRAAPPAKFEYNNCDTIVLAQLLSRITGRPFDTLVEERIARPLGMGSFGMFEFGKAPHPHVAPNGEFANLDPLLNLGVYGASGGAYGTIGDLWRFDHALLSGKLLPSPQRELMWQSSRENGFYGFQQWIFPARLAGCSGEMQVVERQGLVGGIELRNYLLPATGQAVILFSRHRPANYGDPWEGKGFAYDLLSTVACRP